MADNGVKPRGQYSHCQKAFSSGVTELSVNCLRNPQHNVQRLCSVNAIEPVSASNPTFIFISYSMGCSHSGPDDKVHGYVMLKKRDFHLLNHELLIGYLCRASLTSKESCCPLFFVQSRIISGQNTYVISPIEVCRWPPCG